MNLSKVLHENGGAVSLTKKLKEIVTVFLPSISTHSHVKTAETSQQVLNFSSII